MPSIGFVRKSGQLDVVTGRTDRQNPLYEPAGNSGSGVQVRPFPRVRYRSSHQEDIIDRSCRSQWSGQGTRREPALTVRCRCGSTWATASVLSPATTRPSSSDGDPPRRGRGHFRMGTQRPSPLHHVGKLSDHVAGLRCLVCHRAGRYLGSCPRQGKQERSHRWELLW